MKNITMALMLLVNSVQFVFAEPLSHVPKTGQTVNYRAGDDGDLETGVVWPNPRFTVLTTGTDVTVLDRLTGLEWVKSPHSLAGNSGTTNWNAAVDFCQNLVYAGQSDWRLPSIKELESLVNCGTYNPALPTGHPFAGVLSGLYWSGTSSADSTGVVAWSVDMYSGSVIDHLNKANVVFVWPVRGGQ